MKKTIQWLCGILTVIAAVALVSIGYWRYQLPDTYYVEQGKDLLIDETIVSSESRAGAKAVNSTLGESYHTTLRWLGIFPIKDVAVTVVEQPVVVLGGTPFGVKLYTDCGQHLGHGQPRKKCGLKGGRLDPFDQR